MKKIVFICFVFSCFVFQLGYTEDIRFTVSREYCIGDVDQKYFCSAFVLPDHLFVLWGYFYAHAQSTGVMLELLNPAYAPQANTGYFPRSAAS